MADKFIHKISDGSYKVTNSSYCPGSIGKISPSTSSGGDDLGFFGVLLFIGLISGVIYFAMNPEIFFEILGCIAVIAIGIAMCAGS